MEQKPIHRMGKESPAYHDLQMSTRTIIQTANIRKDVVQYFIKAMKYYRDKNMLVIPFNTGNH
jgi:hypothetical protein